MKTIKKIKVESDVEMPTNKTGIMRGRHRYAYPWDEMRVGQSFLFPEEFEDGSVRMMASNAGRRYRRKFTVRLCVDGLRCWRIK